MVSVKSSIQSKFNQTPKNGALGHRSSFDPSTFEFKRNQNSNQISSKNGSRLSTFPLKRTPFFKMKMIIMIIKREVSNDTIKATAFVDMLCPVSFMFSVLSFYFSWWIRKKPYVVAYFSLPANSS